MSDEELDWHGRMPNGEWTHDIDEFKAAWDELIIPCEEILGAVCFAFSPGLSFRDKDDQHITFNIPTVTAQKLVRAHSLMVADRADK